MFDFSFGELLVVGTVALVVIGPERLPTVARTVGAMVARLQRYVAGVKADIQREVELDNLRRLEAEMHEAGRKIKDDLTGELDPLRHSVQEAATAAESALSEPPTRSGSVASASADEQQFDLFSGTATPPPPASPPERDRR